MFFYVSFSNSHEGFLDDVTVVNEEDDATDDYLYDANGNMIQDQNKHITSILYNHLNLPIKVSFDTGSYIIYLYNATGVKINKFVYTITSSNPTSSLTEYIDGFQYRAERKENSRWLFLANEPGCRVGELQFIFTPEGYVNNTVIDGINFFNYVYNYTDLPIAIGIGNIRLSYTWDEEIEDLSILEEHQYYPPDSYRDGLEHKYYNNTRKMYDKVSKEITLQDGSKANIVIPQVIQVANSGYQYQYNGKEWQDELGLAWYDYGARNYDAALGRWMNMDPLAEKFFAWSPYTYALDNPINLIDIDGKEAGNPDLQKVREKARQSKTLRKLEIQAKINSINFSSEVILGDLSTTNPFTGDIKLKENISEERAVLGYAHELTNRKNKDVLKENILDVSNGEITPEEYADNTLIIESEGITNQIVVGSELGIEQANEFQQELSVKYSNGEITKEELTKTIKENLITAVDENGKNARDEYIKDGEKYRNAQLKRSR